MKTGKALNPPPNPATSALILNLNLYSLEYETPRVVYGICISKPTQAQKETDEYHQEIDENHRNNAEHHQDCAETIKTEEIINKYEKH